MSLARLDDAIERARIREDWVRAATLCREAAAIAHGENARAYRDDAADYDRRNAGGESRGY